MQGSPRIDELRQKFHENPRRYFAPLANEYRKAGDPEQAIAICRAHLAQQPQHMSGHVVYGQALYDAKRADEARTVFEKALALDPDNTIVLRQLGDIAREKGESAEARHWYGKALDLDPHDTEAAAYLAELEEPLVGAGEESESGAGEAGEPVADAPLAQGQGDGDETLPEPESIFVMSPDIGSALSEEEPETAEEPGSAGEPASAEESGTPWRKTPHPVESPFVTRTMAELYVKQGYFAAALDVYRQLAIQHPDDSAIRERIEELSPATRLPEQADESAADAGAGAAEGVDMLDSDFSSSDDSPQEAPVDSEGLHFSERDLPRASGSAGAPQQEPGAQERAPEPEENAGSLDEFDDTAGSEIRREDIWGEISEAGDEEAFGERIAELDWTDPGFGFGTSEPEAPENEPVANGARFVELPVSLGEFQTSIDEAGMASTSPHESEIAPSDIGPAEQAPLTGATTDESVEADFREDEAAAAMAAAEVAGRSPADTLEQEPEPSVEAAMFAEPLEPVDEAGVVAYSPEPPRDEDLPHFTPKVPTVREFFAALGSRKPPVAGTAGAYTARAAVPDVTREAQHQADELTLATDAFSNLFPGEEIAGDDTRAAFALSGALSGATHNPVPEQIQTPPQPQKPVATENQTQESEEEIRRFREWLDGLADS